MARFFPLVAPVFLAALVSLSTAKAASPTLPEGFAATVANTNQPPGPAPTGMVWVPGGEFSMGTNDPTREVCGGSDPMPDARPVHRVYVDGFWMDATEVTNAEFAKFVVATNYVTVAERAPLAKDFPGVPLDKLVAGSIVFTPPSRSVPLDNFLAWWSYVPGANWRHPLGPGSDLKGKDHLPVVQVAYEDAVAYARWAKKRLPTEAEWEFAARGGQAGQPYVWGVDLKPGDKWPANIWQGEFPVRDEAEDGFTGLAPVASFKPNAYGLYDMAGNAWEWCSDWYRPDTYTSQAAQTSVPRNPSGPSNSVDPAEPGVAKRVQRGGSFLCTDQYCTRYMVGSRGKAEPMSGSSHAGFRCVKD